LHGELSVNGAKNHVLKLIPAAFLFDGPITIHNVPQVEDVFRLLEIVEQIGGTVNRDNRTVTITPPEHFDGKLSTELVPKLRASLVLIGPLLARYGRVELPSPGGDKIGRRPLNFFVDSFRALGAQVTERDEMYDFRGKKGLRGCEIFLPRITVTGTETIMMAAVLAEGVTVIKNAACEPEVVALGEFLMAQGAKISGIGTHTVTIEGGKLLTGGEVKVIPDRIEAGSFAMLAAATGSDLTITNCRPDHLELPLQMMMQMGVKLETTPDSIHVYGSRGDLEPIEVVTHEYPGFPTDLQSPMTILLTQASGTSHVRETIFEGRLFYTDELNRMGAKISLLDPYRILVDGPMELIGKTLTTPDLRAGIAMLIAGLIAKGTTTIQNIYHIDRGYERIEERLAAIGADITRIRG